MTDIELSVIIPAYNESASVTNSLTAVSGYLKTLGISYELMVVDDGSTDMTAQQVNAFGGIKLISYPDNRGKGFAVNQGMAAARGRFCLFMDMDLSTDLNEIAAFLNIMKAGNVDVLVGNRQDLPLLKQNRPLLRALFGRCFAGLSVLVLNCPFHDFTCGFKMFTQEAAMRIFPRQHIFGWAFDSELMLIARRQRLRVIEQSVKWHHCTGSAVNVSRAVFTSLTELIKIRFYDAKGYYR